MKHRKIKQHIINNAKYTSPYIACIKIPKIILCNSVLRVCFFILHNYKNTLIGDKLARNLRNLSGVFQQLLVGEQ